MRIGGNNEALRNILVDTGSRLSAIDDLRETFGRLTDPLNTILTKLEHERAKNAGVRGALGAMRISHEELRGELQNLQTRSSELEGHNERMRQELESILSHACELEADRAKLTSEVAEAPAAMARIEKQLREEMAQVRAFTEENQQLADRVEVSEKRVVEFEAEIAQAREKLSVLETTKDTAQAAMDRTLAECSQIGRQLADTETALSDASDKLKQTQSTLAMVVAERAKLAAACDDANERRQSEVYGLNLKLEALRPQSDSTEKRLAITRDSLIARAEEIRQAEAKLREADVARREAEKNADKQAAVAEGWEKQHKKFEQDNAELTEKCRVMTETLTTSEGWLIHAKDKIKLLADQAEQFQADATAARAVFEEDFVQLNATLEHERCERTLVEGALTSVRRDYARLQSQIAQERSLRRATHRPRAVRNDSG